MTKFSYKGTPFNDGDTILLLSTTDERDVHNYQFKWNGQNYSTQENAYEITDEGFDNPLIAAELWADDGLRVVTGQQPGIVTTGLEHITLNNVNVGDTLVLGYGEDHDNPEALMEVTVYAGQFRKEHLLEITGPIWDEPYFIADGDVDTSNVWMMSTEQPLWLAGRKSRGVNQNGEKILPYKTNKEKPGHYTPAKASPEFLARMGFPQN